MLEILWVLFIMVSGGIYFGDFERFSKLQLAMFGIGVFTLLLGIFCLIPSQQQSGIFTLSIPCLLMQQDLQSATDAVTSSI